MEQAKQAVAKTVLITGCSSGFGLSLTKALLQKNWRVIATARHPEASAELQALSSPLLSIKQLDVTKSKEVEAMTDYIHTELNGRLDCLINNAGYGLLGPIEELSQEQIRYQMEVNLFGVIFLTQACLPALRAAKGRIINVSSVLGYMGMPLQGMYVTSKYALEGLSESWYYELAPFGVQVSLVEPGLHSTRFGANTDAPHQSADTSVYDLQKKNYDHFRRTYLQSKSYPAENVTHTIVKLLEQKTMPLRKRVGRDANSLYLLRRLLPAFIFDRLMASFYRRIFLKKTTS